MSTGAALVEKEKSLTTLEPEFPSVDLEYEPTRFKAEALVQQLEQLLKTVGAATSKEFRYPLAEGHTEAQFLVQDLQLQIRLLPISSDGDRSLQAQPLQQYTILFDSQGQLISVTEQTGASNSSIPLEFTREKILAKKDPNLFRGLNLILLDFLTR